MPRSWRASKAGVLRALAALALAIAVSAAGQPSSSPGVDPLHRPLDALLDMYVRDGLVYYNALKALPGPLEEYLQALAAVPPATINGWPRERQVAFWLNAYNALVLDTVVDHYPIRGRSPAYPAASIRQIPGAFDGRTHRVGGRTLTLDALETELLTLSGDARVVLALGRGAIGGGRLRSEAFAASRLDAQLEAVAREAVTRHEIVRLDAGAGLISLSPLFSWRDDAFIVSYAGRARPEFASRSPIERAALALIEPALLAAEREFIGRNGFRVAFHEFDWRLNDLSGGR
ncbi:MAG: DUF547 domain-containing protein [Acidobacteriota bacterium]